MSETNLTGIEIQLRVSQLVNQGKAIFSKGPMAMSEGIDFISSLRDEDPRVMAHVQAQLSMYFAEEVERTQKQCLDKREQMANADESKAVIDTLLKPPTPSTWCEIRNEPITEDELHMHHTFPDGRPRCDKMVGIGKEKSRAGHFRDFGEALLTGDVDRARAAVEGVTGTDSWEYIETACDEEVAKNGKLDIPFPPDTSDSWTCTNHNTPITYTDGTSKCYCGAEKG